MKSKSEKALLFLGMYSLDRLDYACPVRIFNLYQNLKSMTPTTLITGRRTGRRWPTLKYLITGQLRKTRCVYVESSTSTATETDLLLLLACKLLSIPIAIYIRDGHQLFRDIFVRSSLKVRILDWLWKRSIRFYILFADRLLFPSQGLAQQFKFSNEYSILPPGGSPSVPLESLEVSSKRVLFIGNPAAFTHSVGLLLKAMNLVVQKYPEAECVIVAKEEDSREFRADWGSERWLHFMSGSFNDLPSIMKSTYVAVCPERNDPYNSFRLPVKLFDYMSFGKPIVATNCDEMAKWVNECNSGLVVEDTPEDFANGIIRLFDNPDLAKELGKNGYRAIQGRHSWRHRAEDLLRIMEKMTISN